MGRVIKNNEYIIIPMDGCNGDIEPFKPFYTDSRGIEIIYTEPIGTTFGETFRFPTDYSDGEYSDIKGFENPYTIQQNFQKELEPSYNLPSRSLDDYFIKA